MKSRPLAGRYARAIRQHAAEWNGNMAYKTLMLQIYKPSGRKREQMDTAILQYSQALQALLDRYREEVTGLSCSGKAVTRQQLLGLIGRDAAKRLNDFGAQPFKDSLKMEFSSIAATFIASHRKNRNAGYPVVFLDDSHYRASLTGLIRQFDGGELGRGKFESGCFRLIGRVERPRSLYFGRYAANREYCLLYDEYKDRFYAKLYLMNRSEAAEGNTVSGLSLRYVMEGLPPMLNPPGKKRYIVVPLAFGRSQYDDLKKALSHPDILHTARLLKKENKYYLMINVECASEPARTASTTMGISRNVSGGLNYTVCDADGQVREKGTISSSSDPSQCLYVLSKEVVRIAAGHCSQVVLEANGGKNDRLLFKGEADAVFLANRQYALMVDILRYKLPEKRLPPPIEVSANGLFCTCPVCGGNTQRNRVSEKIFACINCGHASAAEWIGSENLARRLMKYRRDKVPIYVSKNENTLTFYNKSLDFKCVLPQNSSDYSQMYSELNLLVQGAGGEFESNPRKYAVLKKLRQSPRIRDAVRIEFKRPQN